MMTHMDGDQFCGCKRCRTVHCFAALRIHEREKEGRRERGNQMRGNEKEFVIGDDRRDDDKYIRICVCACVRIMRHQEKGRRGEGKE